MSAHPHVARLGLWGPLHNAASGTMLPRLGDHVIMKTESAEDLERCIAQLAPRSAERCMAWCKSSGTARSRRDAELSEVGVELCRLTTSITDRKMSRIANSS